MNKDEIINLIKELIEKTTVVVNDISIPEENFQNKGKTTWFRVEVEEPQFFLARGAEALLALNHVAKRIIENKIIPQGNYKDLPLDGGLDISIDINDFQKKRIDGLQAVAHMMAERARYFKSSIEVDPMPAFERRIIHEFLSDAADLKTESEGVGPSRRVVIKYIGNI